MQQVNAEFIMQEKRLLSFFFSKYLPCSIFFVHATVGKPGFRGISTFLVLYFLFIFNFLFFFFFFVIFLLFKRIGLQQHLQNFRKYMVSYSIRADSPNDCLSDFY